MSNELQRILFLIQRLEVNVNTFVLFFQIYRVIGINGDLFYLCNETAVRHFIELSINQGHSVGTQGMPISSKKTFISL